MNCKYKILFPNPALYSDLSVFLKAYYFLEPTMGILDIVPVSRISLSLASIALTPVQLS
jgi:hypothetical protein